MKLPKSEWVITPGAFEPLVDLETFNQAQTLMAERTINLTNDQILARLRKLLAVKGKLTPQILQDYRHTPSASTLIRRFGSLRRAYELVGYASPDQFKRLELRRRARLLRDELFNRIVSMLAGKVSVAKKNERWRSRLQLSNGVIVSVLIACSLKTLRGSVRWQVDPHPDERNNPTVLARLTEDNSGVLDLHVFPCIARNGRFRVSLRDRWLKSGLRLRRLKHLCQTLAKVNVHS